MIDLRDAKPCPFCGGTALLFDLQAASYGGIRWLSVACAIPSCDAVGPRARNEDGAIEKWNQREGQAGDGRTP